MPRSARTATARRSKPGILFILLLLFIASIQDLCHGFVAPAAVFPKHGSRTFSAASTTLAVNAVDPMLSSAVVDPTLEAESLTVMAHLALDFSGFVLSPSRSLIRLVAVMGRVCAISADYLLDHSIHTEELMIQLFLISVALKELFFEASAPGNTTTTSTSSTE